MSTLPDPIGKAVQRELSRFGAPGRLGEIVAAWPAAVGDAIAANAWPARVARDGTLHVAARSSTWAFELTQLSSSIVERLRERLGEAAPLSARFAVGPLPEAGPESETSSERTVSKATEAERAEADRIAAGIDAPALRDAVSRAAAASLAAAGRAPADRPVW